MQDQSPILSLPYIQPAQAQKHVTHNEALRRLDALVQLSVADRDLADPPQSTSPGDRHIVAAGATGAWAGKDAQIALWDDGAWFFLQPLPGWRAEVLAEGRTVVFDGATWTVRLPEMDNLEGVGINTASDAANRLAVAGTATLLSHDGSGHRLKINKATPGDTASLLFQTGWSGRAEMGLAGDDAFSIKVSADGLTWQDVVVINPESGAAKLSGDVQIDGMISGKAVQNAPLDTTAGRLMPVGAFGFGNAGTAPPLADLDATDMPSGIYYYSGTATANIASLPNGASGTGTVLVTRPFGSSFTQILTENTAIPEGGETWIRTYSGSRATWAPWRKLYDSQNVVGTVSQASGMPTGAIIERGSNANGEYVRYADGTQMCWNGNAAITVAPAAFIGTITKIDNDKLWIGHWF